LDHGTTVRAKLVVAATLSTAVMVMVTEELLPPTTVSVTGVEAATGAPLTATVDGSDDAQVTIRVALTLLLNESRTVAVSVVDIGNIVAVAESVSDPGAPAVTVAECPSTFTVPVALGPSVLVAVIVTAAAAVFVPVTNPDEFTVAAPPLVGDQVTGRPGR
jgi:hypothetical protein